MIAIKKKGNATQRCRWKYIILLWLINKLEYDLGLLGKIYTYEFTIDIVLSFETRDIKTICNDILAFV